MAKLNLIKLSVGTMQNNCYLVSDAKTKDTLIIDPGDEAEYIENIIGDNFLCPKMIICTHGHFDHVGAVLTLKLVYKIPFFINKNDEFLLKTARFSSLHFTKNDPGPAPMTDGYLKDKQTVFIGKNRLLIMATPGHTPGSICLYVKEERILFSGDTLFANGQTGRTDFSYGSQDDMKKSLEKILALPQETIVHPGHGEKTSIKEEKKFITHVLKTKAIF